MEFFNSAVDTLQTIVIGLGGALCVWGGVNLLEGYGQDNPASKSQGVKQLVAGGGVALIGITLVPLLSGLLGLPARPSLTANPRIASAPSPFPGGRGKGGVPT